VSATAIDYDALAQKHGAAPSLPGVAQPNVQMETSPMSVPEQMAANLTRKVTAAASHATDFGKSVANDVYEVSTPNIADQIRKHFRGEPNNLDKIPGKAVLAFLAAGGVPEAEAGEIAPAEKVAPAADVTTESAADAAGDHVPQPGAGIPRTLSGDSALRQVLTGQDNANLLKIAKSRGLNVARESQLKPGVADNLLINKIVDDFSEDELRDVGAKYLENSRFSPNGTGHQFGDIGAEAWKTKSLQTYFPDVKIPATTLKRVQTATESAAEENAPHGDDALMTQLQESLKRALAAKQKATVRP
jgi:hypothetical protein